MLELRDFIASWNLMAIELCTEFRAIIDSPRLAMQQPKKDDAVIMADWVVYNFDEQGKMKRIRIAHFRMHDAKMAKFAHAPECVAAS